MTLLQQQEPFAKLLQLATEYELNIYYYNRALIFGALNIYSLG